MTRCEITDVSSNGEAVADVLVRDDESDREISRTIHLRSPDETGQLVDDIESSFGPAAAGDARKLLDDAAAKSASGAETKEPGAEAAKSVRQLMQQFPHLRPPIIEGLIRRGETMNVIAPPKTGKSWLAIDLAIAVATGRAWLGQYPTVKGDVLIIDNELHGETCANRIPKVAAARGVLVDEFADHLFVENVRGKLMNLFGLGEYFAHVEAGRFKLVILDAFYRFLPRDTDENDNGSIAAMYSFIDSLADRLGCCFVLIHHSTKGSQAEKSVTDVGAGAGSQARATDTHLILRQHQDDGVVVLDAAVRSWKPVEPFCLRWGFPIWTPEPDLDPTLLRRPGKRSARKEDVTGDPEPKEPEWTPERFAATFITADGTDKKIIAAKAEVAGVGVRKIDTLLTVALAQKLAHRWTYPKDRTVYLASVEQPVTATVKGAK